MSEEEETGHKTESLSQTVKRITNIGTDPWRVRKLKGVLRFKRGDAAKLKVTALDFNGYPVESSGTAAEIKLYPATLYYLITSETDPPPKKN